MEASESLIVAPREYHCITLTHLEEKLAHRCVYIRGFAHHACGEAGTWKGGLPGADLNNHRPANFRGKNGTIDPGSESSSCSALEPVQITFVGHTSLLPACLYRETVLQGQHLPLHCPSTFLAACGTNPRPPSSDGIHHYS